MRKRDFINDPFTWILPFFLELIADTLQGDVFLVFRVLRLTKIFDVLKLSKFNKETNVVFFAKQEVPCGFLSFSS